MSGTPRGDHAVCTICLSEMAVGDTLVRLGCTHLFHKECIDTWYSNLLASRQGALDGNEDMTCPLCRQSSQVGDSVILNGPLLPQLARKQAARSPKHITLALLRSHTNLLRLLPPSPPSRAHLTHRRAIGTLSR